MRVLVSVAVTLRGSPGAHDQMVLYAKALYAAGCLSTVLPNRVSLRIGEIPQAVRLEMEGMDVLDFDVKEIVPELDEVAHELSAVANEGFAVSTKQPRESAPELSNVTSRGVVI